MHSLQLSHKLSGAFLFNLHYFLFIQVKYAEMDVIKMVLIIGIRANRIYHIYEHDTNIFVVKFAHGGEGSMTTPGLWPPGGTLQVKSAQTLFIFRIHTLL